MLGDILIIEEKHWQAAAQILHHILHRKTDKYIVAISGESGSGKTVLAHVLAKLLRNEGIKAKPIHIDNYYRIHPHIRTQWRLENGIENVVGWGEYDWVTIHQNIRDFKADKSSTMPCVDLVTEQIDSLTTDFKGIDMLIIDGLYAIKTEEANLRIFIELTYHETKKAQLLRGKEPQNEYRMRVLEQEHQVVQSLKPTADLFVNMEYKVVEAK